MRSRTKILTTAAAGLLAVGGFAVGAAADGTDTGDVRHARTEMHAQMGGDTGMDMMGDHDMATMQVMHDAVDPAAMDAMHAEMVELLPPELRDDANAMHDDMAGSMTGGSTAERHESHHPDGS